MATLTVKTSGGDYTTLDAAFTAASTNDTIELYLPIVYWGAGVTSKVVSIVGKLSKPTVIISSKQYWYYMSGDFSGQTTQALFQNLDIRPDTYVEAGNPWYAILYQDSGTSGAGVKVDRCRFTGFARVFYWYSGDGSKLVVQSSLFHTCYYGAMIYINGTKWYNNTWKECMIALFTNTGQSGEVKNCYAVSCYSPWQQCTAMTGSNNATDQGFVGSWGTAPGTSPTDITRANAKLLDDLQGFSPLDGRPYTGSSLLDAGTDVSGVDYDINGQAFSSGHYPIGCSLVPPFLESIPAADKILTGYSATNVYGTATNGTFDESARNTDPGESKVLEGTTYKIANVSKTGTLEKDEVLTTSGGNYDASNLTAENVLAGVDYGVSSTGTYPNVDALVAKIDDLQASVDDLTIAGTSYLYAPTAATRDVGDNDGGDYTNMSSHDESYFAVGELAGASTTLGDKLTATVTRGTSTTTQIPSLVRITGRYQGTSGHSVTIQVFNYASSAWENHATMLSRTTDFDYVIPLGSDNHNATTGEMKVRFLHSIATGNASHALYLDWISWEKVATAGTIGSDVAKIYDLLVDVDSETDEIGTVVEAIQAKTDNLPTDPASNTQVNTRLASTGYTAPDNAGISAIQAKTDLLPASPAATSDIPTASANAAAVLLAQMGDGTITVAEALRVALAILAGKSSGHPTAPVFRDLADSKNVVSGTLDADGNRTAVTVNP